jgi:thioredoxin reductase
MSLTVNRKGVKVKTSKEEYSSRAVVISTGASPKQLGAKGEQEYKNRGISYCATCDAPLFSGKKVAVIGGGNHALYAAIQLEGICSQVYVLTGEEKLTGSQKLIDKIKKSPKVDIVTKAQILEIKGKELVNGLVYKQADKVQNIEVEGVFINIGYQPQTGFVQNMVELNAKGEIIVDIKNRTSREGIFAAGDCTNYPYKQIITAAGQGASAVLSAYEYLNNL